MTATVETATARVSANDDPDKRGRIRVVCVALMGDDETDLPMWVEPALDWGWFTVPDVGELVEITYVTSSSEDESHEQMSLDNLDMKWHGARFYNTDEDTPTAVHPTFTSTHYGKRRGFATPLGHFMVFDDTEDAPSLALTWAAKKDAAATELTQLLIDKDGNAFLSVLGKHLLKLEPNKLSVRLNEGATLEAALKDGDATLKVGDGAMHVAIVEHLRTLYGNLKTYVENAFVATGMGPSGTIVAANGPAPSWDSAIESTKVSLPDG